MDADVVVVGAGLAGLQCARTLTAAGLQVVVLEAADAVGDGKPDYPPVRSTPHPFRTALLISLMNPKAILFFVSFFIQFVDPAYEHPALSFVILGVIVQICSVLYLSTLIFAGARLAAQFCRPRRVAAGATAGVGGVFIGFGAKLATATLG